MSKLIDFAVSRLKETPEQKEIRVLESTLKSMIISNRRAISSLEQDVISLNKDLDDIQSELVDAQNDLEEALNTIPTGVDKKSAYDVYLQRKKAKQQAVREFEVKVVTLKNQIIEKDKAIDAFKQDLLRFEA
jgi:predicted secreted protein